MQTKQEIPILTISELTRSIKRQLEQTYKVVWLQGEISNAKLHSSGHFYFCLKDADAQISAVMFRGAMTSQKFTPKDGDKVIVRGEITVYPPQGRYQIIVQEMKPLGIGELLQKLEELKEFLRKKGWFDAKHKKAIPKMPRRIGVVTSPTGAAIQDMLNILTRRFAGFHLILNPVKVQGDGAAAEIAQAIRQFNEHELVDVIIVGRGGGSIEDLWAFNEIAVAEAIFNSKIPIISAVGHETDTTISDFVADLRAPTPSAAAELVIAEKSQQIKHLHQIETRLTQILKHMIQVGRHRVHGIMRQPIFASPYGLLGPLFQRIDHLHKRLQMLQPAVQIRHLRQKMNHVMDQITYAWQAKQRERRRMLDGTKNINMLIINYIRSKQQHFQKLIFALHALDPKNVLKKGYAIPFSEKDGSVITSVLNVKNNDAIRMLLSDGELYSTITNIKKL